MKDVISQVTISPKLQQNFNIKAMFSQRLFSSRDDDFFIILMSLVASIDGRFINLVSQFIRS